MKYKAIIFDLFGTLIENLLSHQYRQILVEVTDILSVEQDGFIDLWMEYSEGCMTGHISIAHCLDVVCRDLSIELSEELHKTSMKVFADRVGSRLEPPAASLAVLSVLRKREYDIGLISNCSDEVPLLWDSSPLASAIQVPVFSSSVGLKKPDPKIFLLAAEKMNVKPRECIFVDDNLGYLRGASEAGMTGVLIQDKTLNSSYSNPDDWDGYAISSVSEMETLLNDL
jgi:putative hydrolase of the HAD superfamily